jgi:hypothetical protein
MIMINGSVHQIQDAHLSDMQVAGAVRTLMRNQLNHESVGTLARDRIFAARLGTSSTISPGGSVHRCASGPTGFDQQDMA